MQSINKKYRALIGPIVFLLTLLLSSCLDQGNKQSTPTDQQPADQTVRVTLGSLPTKTGRYLGTYDEVVGVKLYYWRSDGAGITKEVELEKVTSTYGGASPVTQWTGALEGVIASARYNFKAEAYKDETTWCTDSANQLDLDTWTARCLSVYNSEPVDTYKQNLFNGEIQDFKIAAGANNLQMRMEPIFKAGADQQIPYISSMQRFKKTAEPDNYTLTDSFNSGDQLKFDAQFRGSYGTYYEVSAKVVGTCSPDADPTNCTSINKTFFPYAGDQNGNRFRMCNNSSDWTYEVDSCEEDNSTVVYKNHHDFLYTVPAGSPDQLRIEFTVKLANRDGETWELLGTNSSTWFVITKSDIQQGSELVFMPTIQNMAVTYDTSSDSADLSYAMETHGLSSDISIFANLEYQSVVPLGFPTPYLNIDYNGEGSSTQTLYGRMDKSDLYDANLNINFIHNPTGFVSTADFPLKAYDKPKFGTNSNPAYMWNNFLTSGVCRNCNMSYTVLSSPSYSWDSQKIGPNSPYSTEADYSDPWEYNSPKMYAGDLNYSAIEQVMIQYIKLENTSFMGTNLKDSTFYYTDLSGSQFLNSQIYNTKFQSSLLNNANFTSNDGLPSTQNLPYTNIQFQDVTGDNLNFTDLTTKMVVASSNFANASMSNNLIYQSSMTGMQLSGSFENNDVVETTIESSNFDNTIMTGTSFVSTSIGLSSMKGSDLSRTWFDRASGTSLYLVACDAATVLPVYGNVVCQNGNLEFLEDATQEFVLDLPNGKTRASYLYSSDSDSFRILVSSPKSIAVELTSKDSMLNFNLRKSGENTIQEPDAYGTRTTVRDDGTYTTVWKYYTGLEPIADAQYYYAQISGFEGVYFVTSYFTEDL